MRRGIAQALATIETPFYVYDRERIEHNIETLVNHFKRCGTDIFFAVKANTALSILRIVRRKGLGAEVVSPGELYICCHAGFMKKGILYNNIARKEADILYAIEQGVRCYNFEAIDQALVLERCAQKAKKKIRLFARINPAIFSDTHPHLSTGAPGSKFGMEERELEEIARAAKGFKFSKLVGIHSHIGSQVLSPAPFVKAARRAGQYIDFFRNKGIDIRSVNLGGGFGIPYHPAEKRLEFAPIRSAYEALAKRYGVKVFLEPGRFIVGNAGYIVSRVISVKKRRHVPLYIIDAGMTENPRPALYEAYHHISPLFRKQGRKRRVRVAGPLCENTDEFGYYMLPPLKVGDVLLIHNCGAYTRTMASNYNGRLLPAEYICRKDRIEMIRAKQQYRSLVTNEKYRRI